MTVALADPFLRVLPLTDQAARTEAERCLYCVDAACTRACPTGIDVPGFIRKIMTGNVDGAARTILAANPLGSTCGAVCPVERLCEGACVRTALDTPIAIGRLQQGAVDAFAATGQAFFMPGEDTGKKAAIIGAGPAGLAAAAELRKAGVAVTLYDDMPRPGGLADHGIVPWRMAATAIAKEAAEVERAGATIVRDCRVGRDIDAATLLADNDAVVVAIGLGRAHPLGVPGEDLPGVVDALDVIRHATGAAPSDAAAPLGKKVGVIGGGSTAFDAAAAAVKLGADEVTLFYRRTEAETPAYPHAIDLARRLGITIRWLTAPTAISGDGRVEAATFERMALGEADQTGRRRPVPIAGSGFTVELDTVIRAVGQGEPEGAHEVLEALGVGEISDHARADSATGHTANPKVWAIGDITSGGAEVVNAVEAGKLAAHSIVRELGFGTRIEPVRRAVDATLPGIDLSVDMAGIKSPNPFWLASCPISNNAEMVQRAFDAGWGGAVWKTIGDPIRQRHRPPRQLRVPRPAHRRHQQHRADQRPPDRRQHPRDRRDQAQVPRQRRDHQPHGRGEARVVARDPGQVQRHRRRRLRAQLRLPARHERAGHGRGGRPSARLRPDDHRVGDGEGGDAGHRQAHPQHHRHPVPGARREGRQRRRGLDDQHDQLA